ncbi:hypothetical protein [Actinacidiphila yeochonensis]|uniref:hypothetical protein n=1 Tax=Actinacidiphila yeochonensis TaxID=89050 RepID=UPI000690D769|nr:hypothetical protein [Actinacidiphila yeochonensis]
MEPTALRDALADWTDHDIAGYRLGRHLGVFPRERTFGSVKRLFWIADYPVGEALVEMLDLMAAAGVLLKDEEELRYRWNPVPPDVDWNREDAEAGAEAAEQG